MAAQNENSDSSEVNIGNSWILLPTEEDTQPAVSISVQEKIDKENIERITEQSSFKDIQITSDNKNNKSDTESDGISIISESEFYNGRSDDDSSINSSDDNTADDKKLEIAVEPGAIENPEENFGSDDTENYKMGSSITLEKADLSDNKDDMIQKMLAKNINLPQPVSENIDNSQEVMTSNSSPEEFSNKSNLDKRKHSTPGENKINLTTILCIFCFVVVWACWEHIWSYALENLESPNTLFKSLSRNEFLDSHIDKYSEAFHNYPQSDTTEKYVKKLTKRRDKEVMQEKEKILTATNFELENNFNTDKTSNENYDMEISKYEEKKLKNEENLDKFETNKRRCKKKLREKVLDQLQIHENEKTRSEREYSQEQLEQERDNLMEWSKNLADKEEKLKKWEVELMEREQRINGRNQDFSYRSCNKRNKHDLCKKIKSDKYNAKKQYKENSEDESEIFKTKQFKKFKNKHHHETINIPTQKLKRFKDSYNQKKNRNNDLNKNYTITGEWFEKLIYARSILRKINQEARWWFDRVNSRQMKRDKAFWYFQYMFNREACRYHPKN